ncbi:hypothetical protein DOTSEDRAFT_67664 [Dothistroma septosporum NZE10]|uniref:Transcriptional regulatory protein DEP1 n=1 Tax=Dothistroma septosporum (strain NZE10 / CBS 128990) TaxID=675120 RepID=N1Q2K5_DOTSN|nr:hypothetical protein DOTSEDRAFT_67664 [Dothistroma septosporum NZE10]
MATPTREHTPRPSISPLSARASPVAVRDPLIPPESTNALSESHAGIAEIGDDEDNRSSSLSDPLDDDEVEPPQDGATSGQDTAAVQSLEVDSEAETERLDQTPQKSQKHPDTTGRTPSKLSHAATADDDLSDPPSPIPVGPGAASSTSTDETTGMKRKRSNTAESSLSSADSDLVESPRKRSHSDIANDKAMDRKAASAEAVEVLAEIDEANAAVEGDDTKVDEPAPVAAAKGLKGKKGGKFKGKAKKDVATEPEQEQSTETVQPEGEQSAEVIAKSAEETKHKHAASTAFEDLAKQFSTYREKMNNEKLAAVNAELDMLNQADCKHPEYLRQMACVDARRDKQMREAKAFYNFKSQSLKRTTLGERSQLHSQYFQWARDCREEVMHNLGEDWYNIQKERRQSSQEEDEKYIYKFPTKKSAQIKQQAKYNQEVSVLSGVAKYVGFPAAPEIAGAEGAALEDDLRNMKISKRVPQSAAHPPPVYFPNRTGLMQGQSERIAHEQFIEQNAWARPQGPIQHHGTPNLTHTPDWAAEPGSKHLVRNVSGPMHRTGSPFATPMPHRRTAVEQNSSSGTIVVNSDQPDPPSSVLAAPPTTDRLQHGHSGREQGSPLAVGKHRQNGGERELTGFRNTSNISGASTIDAPPDSAERAREAAREALVGMRGHPVPQHAFEGPLHGPGLERKKPQESFAPGPFRPQEGTFGTPIPLSTNPAAS